MKKILIILCICCSFTSFAQRLEPITKPNSTNNTKSNNSDGFSSFKDRLYFGGGIGFAFANNEMMIDLSPAIGIKFNQRFSGGIGITYKYHQYNDPYINIKDNVYGGSAFLRAFIYAGLYARLEYEHLIVHTKQTNGTITQKFIENYDSFFVGGGYSASVGGRASAFIEILYNLNDTPNSPYTNPVIRVGVLVGI